ncbi:MAG: hypothetical protein WA624_00850 [Methylocella sp.]
MPNIQVDATRRREVIEAHRLWASGLQRETGQIGGTISSLVEGPPVYTPLKITTYSDFEATRFLSVDPRFLDFLNKQGIPFEQN